MCPLAASTAVKLGVAYRTLDSPLGPLLLAATERGLVRVAQAGEDPARVVAQISSRVSSRIHHLQVRLDEASQELDEYFLGRRRAFAVAIDWSLAGGFTRLVLEATIGIPYGEVATYAQVAAAAGSPRAARAAGNALAANPVPIVVPCHRVVPAAGGLGGYGGGPELKARLLQLEARFSP